jgi:hypothetical protein
MIELAKTHYTTFFFARRRPAVKGAGNARCTLGGMTLGNPLQEQLFERRIVLVTGRLDDDAAADAAAHS